MANAMNENNLVTQWKTPSDSENDPWRLLATAVLVCAVKDYEIALRAEKFSGPNGIRMLKKFFNSEWCEALIGLSAGVSCAYDGKMLAQKVERKIKREKERKKAENFFSIKGCV